MPVYKIVFGRLLIRATPTKLLVVLCVLAIFFSWLASGLSGRQPQTVMLDVGFSLGRILLCVAGLLWLQEVFAKPVENKFISQSLAQPLPRYRYLLHAYFTVAKSTFLLLGCYALLLLFAAWLGVSYAQAHPPELLGHYWLAWFMVWLSLLIVIAFALVVTCVSTTPYLSFIVGLGFFIIANAIGPVISYLTQVESADASQKNYILPVLQYVKFIVPDLKFFDVRDWSLYGEAVDFGLALRGIFIAVFYIASSLWLAILLFNRRDFV